MFFLIFQVFESAATMKPNRCFSQKGSFFIGEFAFSDFLHGRCYFWLFSRDRFSFKFRSRFPTENRRKNAPKMEPRGGPKASQNGPWALRPPLGLLTCPNRSSDHVFPPKNTSKTLKIMIKNNELPLLACVVDLQARCRLWRACAG